MYSCKNKLQKSNQNKWSKEASKKCRQSMRYCPNGKASQGVFCENIKEKQMPLLIKRNPIMKAKDVIFVTRN